MQNKDFEQEKIERIGKYKKKSNLIDAAQSFFIESMINKYSYNFAWMGRPIIQYPQDMIAMQEILWKVKPDLVIETGIAHGGSLIYYASILELIGKGNILGIDIDIREHNRIAIETHPMFKRISMIEGSSVSESVLEKVRMVAGKNRTILVSLDSNHTHDHVLKELETYSPFVTKGSYLVVFDTVVEDIPDHLSSNRPWGKGNNPKTAVWKFLESTGRFVIDHDIENKLLITAAPDGYLKCIKDCNE
ncbi:MAG: cephalosporin hydroxylase [Candidatus Scalindua sp.]|jgi:cephalosporin hydroxylase|nr:cephalosporin hydroxylase [Candidatus Scalindua sp.]MBT6049771.1 cephalosporin hydroxylase [Candidatus Scalindua sp.]MBT6230058.1 cephalosporin hydroxylase [Candidatus Scalindua sp.]MBT7211546.1 cephalosporin hydroxylase [Candidatus Scalindua sp.]MBT7589982.1 cephalosporin hydroxylase [Candidatus Scalindua sp.]